MDDAAPLAQQGVQIGKHLRQVEDMLDRAGLEDRVVASRELRWNRQVEIEDVVGALPVRDVGALDALAAEQAEEAPVVEATGGGELGLMRERQVAGRRERCPLLARPLLELPAGGVDRHPSELEEAAAERPRARLVEQQADGAARDAHQRPGR